MIRAVIFDMDGVLIDAKEWHYEALNRALGLYGYSIPRCEHETIYDGLPTKKKLLMLHQRAGLPLEHADVINQLKQRYTIEMAQERCRPTPQHVNALSTLKLMGYRLGVASNSIRQTVNLMMQQSGLERFLDFQLSNEDVTRAKPDPEIYHKAIRHLQLTPEQCLIVEDNDNGIRAARAAGAHVFVVRDVHDVTFNNLSAQIRKAAALRQAA